MVAVARKAFARVHFFKRQLVRAFRKKLCSVEQLLGAEASQLLALPIAGTERNVTEDEEVELDDDATGTEEQE